MKKLALMTSALCAAALLLAGGTARAAERKIVLKVAHADSVDMTLSRKAVMCDVFAREVKARTHGRVEVQIFGAGALGGERDYVEGVKNGFIQAGIASGVMANYWQSAMVTDIPFLFPSNEVADKVMDGAFGQKLADGLLAATGMRVLGFGEVGFRHFTSGSFAIHSPKDLQGRKIRVQETPLYITMMKALGAQPTPVAWPETYTALQTGVVDGEENPISSIVNAKLYEVQKHVTLDGHVYGVDWFIINDRFFKGLAPDLQKAVLESAKLACAAERKSSRDLTVSGIKLLNEHGVAVYTPTAEEFAAFRKLTQQPVIEWLKTKVDANLIASALDAVNAAGK